MVNPVVDNQESTVLTQASVNIQRSLLLNGRQGLLQPMSTKSRVQLQKTHQVHQEPKYKKTGSYLLKFVLS